jgi:hypothetical protein
MAGGLKILFSEMDPAEVRLARVVIIERGAKVFRKNPRVPHLVRAL